MRNSYHRSEPLLVHVVLVMVLVGLLAVVTPMGTSGQTPISTKPTPTLPQTGSTVKVGFLRSLSLAPVFVAFEKGYFEEQGLKVELLEFRSASDMMPFLSTGDLDVGGGEIGSALFNAVNQGLDVKVVASVASEPPGYGATPLLVRKDLFESGQITIPADLKGKKVALNGLRRVAEYLLSEALSQGGLTVDDVELVSIPNPEIPVALANKAVDAAIATAPYQARALDDGSAMILLAGDKITDTPQIGVLHFGRRLLDPANREVGLRFLSAYLKGARELYGDGWLKPDNLAILNSYTHVDVPVLRKTEHHYCDPNGQINKASVESMQDYYFRRRYTELSKPLTLSQVIDDTFLTQTIERLGRFER